MPVQTTKKGNIYFKDGAQCLIKESGAVSFTDIGALNGPINLTLVYDENQVNTANAGYLDKQIKNMTVDGSTTLINLNQTDIARLGGGLFTNVTTTTTPVTTVPDQTIAAGWANNTYYDLDLQTSSTDSTQLHASAIPTFTSITLDPTGTPEVLVAGTEYVIAANSNSPSGYSIQFISSGMATGSPTTFEIVINYDSVTPVASITTYAGSSSTTLAASELRFQHTDDNGLQRTVDLYSADANSGSFQLNFGGANEDGVEEIALAFTGKLDTSRTNGRQLLAWTVESGAA